MQRSPLCIRLAVPYFSQLDNRPDWHGTPHRQCNLTSTAMMLDFVLAGGLSHRAQAAGFLQADDYYGYLLKTRFDRDTPDNDGHTLCLREAFAIDSHWSEHLCEWDLRSHLKANLPIVIGVNYKTDGHILCIVGLDEQRRGYWVHDPYGIRQGSSDRYDIGAHAAYDFYSFELMDQIFWDLGIGQGWGRIITAIAGKPTGLGPTGRSTIA